MCYNPIIALDAQVYTVTTTSSTHPLLLPSTTNASLNKVDWNWNYCQTRAHGHGLLL